MELQELVKPLAIEEPRACDFCHGHNGVRYLDHDVWACVECARRYLARLEWKG